MFKENKRSILIIISLAFLFTFLSAGYLSRLTDIEEKSKKNSSINNKSQQEGIKKHKEQGGLETSLINKNIINKDTKMVYKIKYKECGHETTRSEPPSKEMLGLNRTEFEEFVSEKLQDLQLDMFSKEEIHLSSEKNTLCTNHFVVGETNGRITIFKIDENGERIVHRIFKDATISTVREDNQKRLKDGIVVESEDEAIQVLEDFIS